MESDDYACCGMPADFDDMQATHQTSRTKDSRLDTDCGSYISKLGLIMGDSELGLTGHSKPGKHTLLFTQFPGRLLSGQSSGHNTFTRLGT